MKFCTHTGSIFLFFLFFFLFSFLPLPSHKINKVTKGARFGTPAIPPKTPHTIVYMTQNFGASGLE